MASKKNRRPSSPQLIPGDYEHPFSENENRWGARKIFLDLLPQIAPKTIDRLREVVYQPFCQFKKRMADEGVFGVFYSNLDRARGTLDFTMFIYGDLGKPEAPASYKEIQRALAAHYLDTKLSAALLAWATEFHIVADWILDSALFTMNRWSQGAVDNGFPLIRRPMFHSPALIEKFIADVQQLFVFQHPGWNPFLRTEASIKEEIRADFEERLSDYIARMKAMAETYGTPVVKKQRLRDESPHRHIEWFIRSRVLGQSYREIGVILTQPGGKKSPANKARAGVQKIASLLGFQD